MPTAEMTSIVKPIMFQPMWVTIIIQILTLIVAGGISFGITKARLITNEKEIVALQARMVEIERDFNVWQRQYLATVVTNDDCDKMQHVCKESICQKIEQLSRKVEDFLRTAESNWRNMALVTGRICEKLSISPPEFK